MKHRSAIIFICFCILSIVLLAVLPCGQAAARPVTKLTVDVWMDRGGQGLNVPGGQYSLGEHPVIYFTVSVGCQASILLSGPDGTNSWQQQAVYGQVYQISLGVAETVDIGQWSVVLNAVTSTGDQSASDSTSFTIIGTASTTPLPTPLPEPEPLPTPEPEPDTGTSSPPPVDEVTTDSGLDTTAFNTLDALKALKMAEGLLTIDLNMDANGDGQVTEDDARLILQWAVSGGRGITNRPEIITVESPPDITTPSYDEVIEADTDENGVNDRKSYYKDDALVMTSWDTDADGKDDLWFHYDDEEYLTLEAADLNGDGEPDEFVHMDKNETITRVEKVEEGNSGNIWIYILCAVLVLVILGIVFYFTVIRRKSLARGQK